MMKQRNYYKLVGLLILIFILGGVGGVLGSHLFLPWLANYSPFNQINWILRSKDGTTIINKTERVVINQDLAYQEAIGRLLNSAAAVRSERARNNKTEILAEGTGFVLTSDGAIATANILVPENAGKVFVVKPDGKEFAARVTKRDKENGLALLKIEETNLPVVNFADPGTLKLGEMVFLLGADYSGKSFAGFTNIGFLKTLSSPSVNFTESQKANGSPMADSKGDVIGLNLVDKNGVIKIVGQDKIRELLK